jgi:hypothetical protein
MTHKIYPKHAHLATAIAITIAACAGDASTPEARIYALETKAEVPAPLELVASPIYYSAFDGEHTYQVPLGLKLDPDAADPVQLATVKWSIAADAVRVEPEPSLPGGILVTTKRAGLSKLQVKAETKSGRTLTDEITLVVTQADPLQWEHGDAVFNDNEATWPKLPVALACDAKPVSADASSACTTCHAQTSSITVPITGQIAALSDDQLLALFAEGQLPPEYVDPAPFMRNLPEQDKRCVFNNFHAWDMSEETQLGLLFKLRSMLPFPEIAAAP